MPISNPSTNTFSNIASLQTDHPLLHPGGRLTLSPTNPIADVANSRTVYYLPYLHSIIPIWNSTAECWEYRRIPETGLSNVRGLDFPRNIDVYAAKISSSPDEVYIDTQSWQDATYRSYPLYRKNGILCLSQPGVNTPPRTYLGTIRILGASPNVFMVDTESQRFVYNAHNQVERRVLKMEAAGTWQDNAGAWKPLNSSSLNRVEVLDGLGEGILDVTVSVRGSTQNAGYVGGGIAIDNITNPELYTFSASGDMTQSIRLSRPIPIGYHYAQAMQVTYASTPITYYGQGVSGLIGTWKC